MPKNSYRKPPRSGLVSLSREIGFELRRRQIAERGVKPLAYWEPRSGWCASPSGTLRREKASRMTATSTRDQQQAPRFRHLPTIVMLRGHHGVSPAPSSDSLPCKHCDGRAFRNERKVGPASNNLAEF